MPQFLVYRSILLSQYQMLPHLRTQWIRKRRDLSSDKSFFLDFFSWYWIWNGSIHSSDGVSSICRRGNESIRVSCGVGHQERILAHSNLPPTPKVPPFHIPKPPFPVYLPFVWAYFGPKTIYQGDDSGCCPTKDSRSFNNSIFGKYFKIFHGNQTPAIHSCGLPIQPGMNNQYSKIVRSPTCSTFFDTGFRHSCSEGWSSTRQDLLTTVRFMQVLGSIVCTIEAVPFAYFCLQRNILVQWSVTQRIQLLPQTRTSLSWWFILNHLARGKSFVEPHWLILTTDANLQGWVTLLGHLMAQGTWSH